MSEATMDQHIKTRHLKLMYRVMQFWVTSLGGDAIYHNKCYWTALAIWFACQRFIPYFRIITCSDDDLLEEVLLQHLVPCAIEFGIDGTLEVGFQSFLIDNRQSDLSVGGKVGFGFTSAKDVF